MKLSMIVATSWNGEIGKNGRLPWDRIPEDMANFRRITMGKPVIMGKKTWVSMEGKPLDGRKEIILSRTLWEHAAGPQYYVVRSPVEAIVEAFDAHGTDEAFIIGGSQIYKLFAPICDEAHVTTIQGYYGGNTYFPFSFTDNPEWSEVERVDLREGVHYRRYLRKVN